MKKGFLFTILVCMLTIVLLVQSYFVITEKKMELQGQTNQIGYEQSELLLAQMKLDNAHYYVELSAKEAVRDALSDLAMMGTSSCGWNQGIPIYATQSNGPGTCITKTAETLSKLILKNMNPLLMSYPETIIPIKYVSVMQNDMLDVYGTSDDRIVISYSDKRGRLSGENDFHIRVDYDIGDYKTISDGIERIRDECNGNDPSLCVNNIIGPLDNDRLHWTLGACTGNPLTDDRVYTFCVETKTSHAHNVKGVLKNDPIRYSFAVYIPASAPIEITSFMVNGLPSTGVGNTALALKEGDKADYRARIKVPYDKFTAQICLGDKCENADTLESNADEYIARGTMESPRPPYQAVIKIMSQQQTITSTQDIKVLA